MVDTYTTCLGSSVHKLGAYPQESDLPSLSNHRSMDGKPSCESDTITSHILETLIKVIRN
jgi:hypothetical protein